MRSLGFEQDDLRDHHGIVFAVRSADIQFIRPARFNDRLRVSAELAELKRASLTFSQTIARDAVGGELLCSARIRIACISAETFSPCAIPDQLLQRIHDDV